MKRGEEWSEHQRVWIWQALTVLQRERGSDPLDALHDECVEEDTLGYLAMNAHKRKLRGLLLSTDLLLAFTTSISRFLAWHEHGLRGRSPLLLPAQQRCRGRRRLTTAKSRRLRRLEASHPLGPCGAFARHRRLVRQRPRRHQAQGATPAEVDELPRVRYSTMLLQHTRSVCGTFPKLFISIISSHIHGFSHIQGRRTLSNST